MASGAPPAWPPGPSGAWNQALAVMAAHPKPETLPPDVYLRHDEHTLTIYDGYPKAKYHFLILPRMPFKFEKDFTKDGEPGQPKNIDSIMALMRTDNALDVLERLAAAAEELKPMIKDEMRQTPLPGGTEPAGVHWNIQAGFHALPSMAHLHLHVMSADLISPCLKNKKHYNSFNPRGGFWLDLYETIELARRGEHTLRKPNGMAHFKHERDNAPLLSIYTGATIKNMPTLKTHLQEMWEKQMHKRAERLRLTGTQDHPEKAEQRALGREGVKNPWTRIPREDYDPDSPKSYDHLTGKRKRAAEKEAKSISVLEADKWALYPGGKGRKSASETSETESEDDGVPREPATKSKGKGKAEQHNEPPQPAKQYDAPPHVAKQYDEPPHAQRSSDNDFAASKWISEAEAHDVLPRAPRGKAKAKQPEYAEPLHSQDAGASGDKFV